MLVLVGLTGLIASFHSIIYAYGRQIFALSRAGYFPRFWSLTMPSRHTPHVALIGGGIIGLILAFILKLTQGGVIGFALLTMAVVGGAISYILMMASYIVIKRRMPHLNRPYVSPGGELFAWIAGILAVISLLACFAIPDYRYGAIGVVLYFLVGLVYFWLWGRHNLVAEAPEEESALIEAAQKELGQASA
jgi:ethanolamine permease